MTQIGSAHPEHWYNLAADFPEPMPPALNPVTREPLAPADLEPLFPRALIAQETSTERFIEIPPAVREVYAKWRPSPLIRADRLERAVGTRARIFYKYEGVRFGHGGLFGGVLGHRRHRLYGVSGGGTAHSEQGFHGP